MRTFLIELWTVVTTNKEKASCSRNSVNKLKTAEADEKEADNVGIVRRIKQSVLKGSEVAVIVNLEKNHFRLGRQVSCVVSWTRILRVCKTNFHISKTALPYVPK